MGYNGGTSYVGSIRATGGGANSEGTAAGGTPNGAASSTAGWSLSIDPVSGASNPYGKGGTCDYWDYRYTGGQGGKNTGYLEVKPGQQITCVVGAKGDNYSHTNVAPTGGFVMIQYGGSII